MVQARNELAVKEAKLAELRLVQQTSSSSSFLSEAAKTALSLGLAASQAHVVEVKAETQRPPAPDAAQQQQLPEISTTSKQNGSIFLKHSNVSLACFLAALVLGVADWLVNLAACFALSCSRGWLVFSCRPF